MASFRSARLAAGHRTRRDRHDRGALGVRQEGAGRQRHRHAAEQRIPVPSADEPARRRPASIGYSRADQQLDAPDRAGAWRPFSTRRRSPSTARGCRRKASIRQRSLEGERFRSALLSSISHDLKTPLATITGAVTSLRQLGDRMKPASRDDLLASIEEESERLSRFVANLLDMTRIEAGTVDAKRDWVDVADVIRARWRGGAIFPRQDDRNQHRARPAADQGRQRAARPGAVQPDRQCDQDMAATSRSASMRAATRDEVVISVTDLGKGIPAKELGRKSSKNSSGAARPTAARPAPASAWRSPRALSRRWAERSRRRARRRSGAARASRCAFQSRHPAPAEASG